MTASCQLDPSRARWGAVVLVLVQCATLALLEEGHRFGIAMGVLALGSLWERLRISPERAFHWLWFALLAVAMAVKHRLAPEAVNEQITFFNTVIAYETARFLIILQVYQLYLNRPMGRIPGWFAGVAALNMVFASNVRLNPHTQPVAVVLSLAYVAALAVFASLHRRRLPGSAPWSVRTIATVVLLMVLGGGLVLADVIRRYEVEFERWLAGNYGPHAREDVSVGFSGRGELGCIHDFKQSSSHLVSLRIHAPSAPGYLRGRVFDEFHGSIWAESAQWRDASPIARPPFLPLRPTDQVYRLDRSSEPRAIHETLDVWPDASSGERLFYPLQAAYIGTRAERLTVNSNDMAERIDAGGALPFSLHLEAAPHAVPLDPEARYRFLTVDALQQFYLRPFADEVFAGCRTTDEKLAAVTRYFHSNFRYALQPQPGEGPELIVDFLRSRRPAHCEFFASAGALLLRLAGIPSRYVTGYVSSEWNNAGKYWVARRRDAHAWIEAYDEHAGVWRVVECTPPGGVPSETSEPNTAWSDWWDAKQQRLREWLHHATSRGILAFGASLLSLVVTPAGLACLILGIAGAILWRQRKHALVRRLTHKFEIDPELGRSLRSAEGLARRLGFHRRSSETLSQFAARLRCGAVPERPGASTLADWYDEYVRVRYGEVSGQARAELSSRLRSVSATLRGGRLLLRRIR